MAYRTTSNDARCPVCGARKSQLLPAGFSAQDLLEEREYVCQLLGEVCDENGIPAQGANTFKLIFRISDRLRDLRQEAAGKSTPTAVG